MEAAPQYLSGLPRLSVLAEVNYTSTAVLLPDKRARLGSSGIAQYCLAVNYEYVGDRIPAVYAAALASKTVTHSTSGRMRSIFSRACRGPILNFYMKASSLGAFCIRMLCPEAEIR